MVFLDRFWTGPASRCLRGLKLAGAKFLRSGLVASGRSGSLPAGNLANVTYLTARR